MRDRTCALLLAAMLLGVLAAALAPHADAQPGSSAYQFSAENGFSVKLADKPSFTAKVPAYTLRSDLGNVANLKQFADRLRPQHLRMAAKNGFVVAGANWKQMEYVYELNNYRPQHLPSVATADSVLHSFHIFFDYCLRTMEAGTLYDRAEALTRGLVNCAAARYGAASYAAGGPPEVKQAATRNYAYCLVPARLLAIPDDRLGVTVPQDVADLVTQELALIEGHQGFEASPTVKFKVDYSQFVPRGHYTRSDKLKRYFKTLMWYGLVPVALRNMRDELSPDTGRQAVLLADMLLHGQVDGGPIGKVWEDLYEPTAFLVGFADDNTPGDYGKVIPTIFGEPLDVAKLVPTENIEQLAAEVLKLRPPGIVMPSITRDPELPGIPQFRLIGQRFVLDSHIFQMMVYPNVGEDDHNVTMPGRFGKRTFPMGLDAMAILGSQRAFDIADKAYEQTKFKGYADQLGKLRSEVAGVDEARWTSNVYYGWLHTLKYLLETKGDGYPTFMRNQAWVDKQLNAALGSWTELRHDTILYAKQSVVAECGGGEEAPSTPPKGYVEPEVMTYWRLRLLATQLRDGLKQRGLLSDEAVLEPFNELISLLGFLEHTSIKELTGVKLTADEYEQIEYFGDALSRLNLYTKRGSAGDEITSMTDKDMAIVADVHTGPVGSDMFALEEGVGHANEVYIVYPCEGKLLMGRGAVYSYYEFTQPLADRLTDEKWQAMLLSSKPPTLPKWVTSFYGPPAKGETGAKVERGVKDFTKGGC